MNKNKPQKSFSLNSFIQNDRLLFIVSIILAFCVWVSVVVFASPKTTRIIKRVPVTIDQTLVSQFSLKLFGQQDFYVDVTVTGKKYQVSSANLKTDDIVIEAVTTGVNSSGYYDLQLRAVEQDGESYSVTNISPKTVKVYFDTEKTLEFAVEPKISAKGLDITEKGFFLGQPTVSVPTITVTGPSAQVDKIKGVAAELTLEKALKSNASAETSLVPVDENGKPVISEFVTLSSQKAVVNVPVLRIKKAKSIVTFKNAPADLVSSPLKYVVSPGSADFNVLVEEYDNIVECSIGVIDYKLLSPSTNVFKFDVESTNAYSPGFKEFTVKVNMKDYTQEHINVGFDRVNVNNPQNLQVNISAINKHVTIVGQESDLKKITPDMITIDVDLSLLEIEKGETIEVPAVVNVESNSCWVYGVYTIKVTA